MGKMKSVLMVALLSACFAIKASAASEAAENACGNRRDICNWGCWLSIWCDDAAYNACKATCQVAYDNCIDGWGEL